MKVLITLFSFFFITAHLHAKNAMYFSATMLPLYASGNHASKSALLGTGFGVSGGVRLGTAGFEISGKRFKVESEHIGDKDFDTRIFDSLFATTARLYLDKFNLKFGLAMHNLDMEVSKNNSRRKDLEDNGTYVGLLGGMGINHEMGDTDFYFESTLYPIPDVDLFIIDFGIGLRFYL